MIDDLDDYNHAPAGAVSISPVYRGQTLPPFAPVEPADGWTSASLFDVVAAYAEDVADTTGFPARGVATATQAQYIHRHGHTGLAFVMERLRGVDRIAERWPEAPRFSAAASPMPPPEPDDEDYPF